LTKGIIKGTLWYSALAVMKYIVYRVLVYAV